MILVHFTNSLFIYFVLEVCTTL